MTRWLNNRREVGESLTQALQRQDKYNHCHTSQRNSESRTSGYIQYSLYSRVLCTIACFYTYFMVSEEYCVSLRKK
jgi:hypothetical protein